eukprot:10028538-Heterocapsa_arctica.AAC.1
MVSSARRWLLPPPRVRLEAVRLAAAGLAAKVRPFRAGPARWCRAAPAGEVEAEAQAGASWDLRDHAG